MANQTRHERQFMRQRGAGGRNIGGADFGLNITQDDNRNARQQMRQRGAGNRKVDTADFGLSFPGFGRSSRSRSKTPAPRSTNKPKISRTSVRRSRELSIPQQRRSASVQSATEQAQRNKDQRMSLSETQQLRPNHNEHQVESLGNADGLFFPDTVNEEENDADFELDDDVPPVNDQVNHDKENVRPEGSGTTKKRKMSTSNGQQSIREKLQNMGDPPMVDQGRVASNDETPVTKKRVAAKRPKKRKSVVLVKKKRRSSEGIGRNDRRKESSAQPVSEADPEVVASEEDQPVASRQRPRRRGSSDDPRQSSAPPVDSIEVDDASDDEYVDEEHSPDPETPAPTKRTIQSAVTRRNRKHKAAARNTSRRSKPSDLPITTYRMTNINALPTVPEENELEKYSDEETHLDQQSSFTDRAVPNAVDILAQVCREVVVNAVDNLSTNNTNAKDRGRKRAALEAFGEDLDSRLFDMSASVEDRLNLEGRSRKVKRQKADLQSRWVEVRKRRERIALRCDRVRREHWENEREREDKWQISEAAHQAELELDRSDVEDGESLEFLLRSVAGDVSNRSDQGGLLNRIRTVNADLEKLAGIMEGREV